ncbi:AEC family transporter [Candidatus Bandiella euplotis]|uniref:Permease n=1 Tax=Candidatus Bandiella euplotis TaxID=1664265 RepID=A0ABZ0UN88_9RICK|nr:AEC family transporter [Candidatus Bandiella woodruffii]WPX96300.1 Putative permease [Candidatus Bandiella woodruffii]
MSFFSLLSKILPLYIIAIQGYIAGKLYEIDTKSLSKLMFHFILPVIFFDVALNTKIELKYAILPVICFTASCALMGIGFYIASKLFNDGRETVIAYAAGSVNTSSVGLSIVLLVFDDEHIRIFMLSSIGIVLFVYSVGYIVISSNTDSWKKMSYDLIRLPPIYAFIMGLCGNLFDIQLFDGFNHLFSQMRTTYLVLGMLVFGLSLSKVNFSVGKTFISLFIVLKTIISPGIYLLFILLDKFVLHIYDNEMYKLLFTISALPTGVDCIVLCSLYHKHPEKAAVGVLIGTLIATIYIPFFLQFF